MDVQAIWIVVVAISAPVGAAVGFAIQLRMLRAALLTNQKLELELKTIKAQLDGAEKVIVRATPDEIERYGDSIKSRDVMCARAIPWNGVNPGPDEEGPRRLNTGLANAFYERLFTAALAGLVLAILAYLLYDLVRVGQWLYALLT